MYSTLIWKPDVYKRQGITAINSLIFTAGNSHVQNYFSYANTTARGRGNIDYVNDKYQQEIYASTSPGIAGENGRYIYYTY